jgi:hypothetical protein
MVINNISNVFLVAATVNSTFTLLNPPLPGRIITREEALVLAAWLVAIADDSESHVDFLDVLKQVEAT